MRTTDGRMGTVTPLCREYSNSRSYLNTRVLAANPAETIIGPVQEVRTLKVHDGYAIEVAIPSIWKPKDTSYVVISWETERFVNEIHNHTAEVRSVMNCSRIFKDQKERWTLAPRKLGQWLAQGNLMQALSALLQTRHPYTQKESSLWMKRNGLLSRLMSSRGRPLQCRFQRRLLQCCLIVIKRNDRLMVQDIRIQANQFWWESLHMKEREISMTKHAYKWFLKAAQSEESNIAKTKMDICVIYEPFRDLLVGIYGLCTWLSQVEKVSIS